MDSWGPFEIILVLVLAIGVLTAIGKNPVVSAPAEQAAQQELSQSEKRCGLSVTAPLSKEKVSGYVHLAGSINGCKWQPKDGAALYAQVIDAKGRPVSDFISVPVQGDVIASGSLFDTTLTLNTPPKGSGTLILIPATTPDGDQQVTVRIPLQFVQ